MLPTIEIQVHAVDRHGQFATTLNGKPVCSRSRSPFFDSARHLIESGYDPDAVLVMFREGTACLLGRLGDAAGLTVDENHMRFAPWRAFCRSAVASPIRESRSASPQGHSCGSERIGAGAVP
jgi:hypothetical protein